MANPTIFSYTIRDHNGVRASTRAYAVYDGALETVDALIGNWLQLGTDLDACTAGVIEGGSITIPTTPDAGWKDTPTAGEENDVSDVISLNFINSVTTKAWAFLIPAFLETLLTSGGAVDLADAALSAVVTLLGSSFTNGSYANSSGQDLTALKDAFQSDRKHRKQIVSRSRAFPS